MPVPPHLRPERRTCRPPGHGTRRRRTRRTRPASSPGTARRRTRRRSPGPRSGRPPPTGRKQRSPRRTSVSCRSRRTRRPTARGRSAPDPHDQAPYRATVATDRELVLQGGQHRGRRPHPQAAAFAQQHQARACGPVRRRSAARPAAGCPSGRDRRASAGRGEDLRADVGRGVHQVPADAVRTDGQAVLSARRHGRVAGRHAAHSRARAVPLRETAAGRGARAAAPSPCHHRAAHHELGVPAAWPAIRSTDARSGEREHTGSVAARVAGELERLASAAAEVDARRSQVRHGSRIQSSPR